MLFNILVLSLIIFFFYYLSFVVYYIYNQKYGKLLPGPIPLPIIGSLHLLLKNFDSNNNPLIHKNLQELIPIYGKVYGIWLGSYYTIIVAEPNLAHEMFVQNGKNTSDRSYLQYLGKDHVPSMKIATRNGKGIAMSSGNYWRRVRTSLEKNISRILPAEKSVPYIMIEIKSIIYSLKQNNDNGNALTNLTTLLKKESLNISMQLLFSERFGNDITGDFKILQNSVEYLFENLSSGNPSDMIPVLRLFPNKNLKKMQNVVDNRDKALDRLISKEKNKYKKLRQDNIINTRDDCYNMCHEFFFDEENGLMSLDEIHTCIWDVIFAMTDTTATTIEWLIYFIINHPEIQDKMHSEIDQVIGSERLPMLEDIDKLPYFNSVIKEVMRKKIVSPLMAPHYVNQEFNIMNGKYKIPLGSAIFMHGYAMALDRDYWKNPDDFNPDRWFDEDNRDLILYGKEKRKKLEHYKFIPFSLGPRMCPGYSFAKISLYLQAISLIQSFKWVCDKNYKMISNNSLSGDTVTQTTNDNASRLDILDLTENWGLTIMPKRHGDFGVIYSIPRNSSKLGKLQKGD